MPLPLFDYLVGVYKRMTGVLFSESDSLDKRIAESQSDFTDYPATVDAIPDKAGVYVFVDEIGIVVYVGKAGGGRLRQEVKDKKGTRAEKDATGVRWFRTNSDDVAIALEADWIAKYKPRNNILGK